MYMIEKRKENGGEENLVRSIVAKVLRFLGLQWRSLQDKMQDPGCNFDFFSCSPSKRLNYFTNLYQLFFFIKIQIWEAIFYHSNEF